jgi:hypothetical protein
MSIHVNLLFVFTCFPELFHLDKALQVCHLYLVALCTSLHFALCIWKLSKTRDDKHMMVNPDLIILNMEQQVAHEWFDNTQNQIVFDYKFIVCLTINSYVLVLQ